MFIYKIIFVVFIIVSSSCAKKQLHGRNTIRGTKLTCSNWNKDYVESFSCSIRLMNRTTQLYNVGGVIKPNISVNWVHAKITSYYKFSVIFRKTLIYLDEDICGMFDGSVPSKFLSQKVLAENLNVIEGCPYKTGPAYLKGIRIGQSLLVDILPTGTWRIDFDFYTRNGLKEIPLFMLKFFFEVKYEAVEQNA